MLLAVAGLVFTSLQFVLQFKMYFDDRKKRKRQEHQQQQQHILHYPQAYITYCICYNHHVQYYNMQPAPSYPLPNPLQAPAYDWLGLLGGRIEPLHCQRAPHNTRRVHETLGMRTGASADNRPPKSYNHWKSLQIEMSSQWKEGSIAVVDRSKGNIDMFTKIEQTYFRSYRITNCDVVMFAHLFKAREVFSGDIRYGKLNSCSKEMKMLEMESGVQSTNSWTSLGINDDSEDMKEVIKEKRSFIQTVRGAVLGLLCCLYEDESIYDLNVDMETPPTFGDCEILRINTHRQPCHIVKRNTCFFSVFSFGDLGWASQTILIG